MRAVLLLIILSSFALACTEPRDGPITQSQDYCPGTYTLLEGIVIDADNIEINCDNTVIKGKEGIGILVRNKDNAVVRGCTVQGFPYGIVLISSEESEMNNNIIQGNDIGILLRDSEANTIRQNSLYNNSLSLYSSDRNIIRENTINSTSYTFYMNDSSDNTITENIVSSKVLSFFIEYSTENKIYGNDIYYTGFAKAMQADTQNYYSVDNVENRYHLGALGPEAATESVLEPIEPEVIEESPEPEQLIPTPQLQEYSIDNPPGLRAEAILRKALMIQGISGNALNRQLDQKLDDYIYANKTIILRKDMIIEQNTRVVTKVKALKRVKDVYIYEYIPKCMANSTDDIIFNVQPTILESDPLIVWYFPELSENEEVELSYEVKGRVEHTSTTVAVVNGTQTVLQGDCAPECVPTAARREYWAFMPLLLIPVIVFLYVFFYRYRRF